MSNSGQPNWGRWGGEDQLGSLNLNGPDVVRRALEVGRAGKVVSLSLELHPRRLPRRRVHPPFFHAMLVDGADFEAGARRGKDGFQFADDFISMPTHTGTHLDALSHIAVNGRMYNDHQAADVRSATGAAHLGMEHFHGMVCPATLLDIPKLRGRAYLNAGEAVSAEDIERALGASGAELLPGDAVLVRTGWLSRWADLGESWFESEPGIDEDAARWLAARDVALVGSDNFAIEVLPPRVEDATRPVHVSMLQKHGIYLMEMVNLERLVEVGVARVALVIAPLLIVGGVGSPLNPLAIY